MADHPHFLKDLEVREMASLDHGKLATAIVAGIRLASPPFRVALFGPWGSGKSTILKLVQDAVEHAGGDDDDDTFYRTFWFNAWEHESSSNLFHSLLALLAQEIPDGVRYSKKGGVIVGRVLEAARVHGRRFERDRGSSDLRPHLSAELIDPEGLESLGVESIRADIERFTDMLLVAGGKRRERRAVVFIDDLDKCLPLQALALLESIKLFFGTQAPVVFICSMDAEVLRQVVRSKYAESEPAFADSYIEKVFEFGFEVPRISTLQVKGLVEEIYRRAGLGQRGIPPEQQALETRVLESVLSRPGLTLNPRRIKRIFNRFIWYFCHEPPFEPAAVHDADALDPWLVWLLATDYWRDLRDYVGRFGEVAFRELGNRVTGHPLFPHSNDAAKQVFNNLPDLRHVVEFFRSGLHQPPDPHLAESQEEMRSAVMHFAVIDAQLRAYGM